jgi:hypothetical protein
MFAMTSSRSTPSALPFPASPALVPGMLVEGLHLGATFTVGRIAEVLRSERPESPALVILASGEFFSSRCVRVLS